MKRPPLPARLLFSLLLITYPQAFRRRFALEMRRFFDESYDEHARGIGMRYFWLRTYWLLLVNGFSSRLDLRRRVRAQRASRAGLTFNERAGVAERAFGLVRNLGHSVRSLRSCPSFTLTSVLTLGLAIGACTMIFSVVYPVLLSPLPYPDADEIASLYEKSPGPDGVRGWASPLTVRDWQERSREFERIVSYRLNIFTWTGGPEPALLRGWAVSQGYFPLMGLGMTLGRGFTPEEDEPSGERVVVLSHSLWSQHFGGDPDVLGRGITLDGAPYTIIGVAHPEIAFPSEGDYWIPAAIDYSREMRDFRYIGVIGRLRDGSSLAEAEAELVQISRQIAAENPETNTGWSAAVRGLKDTRVAHVRPILVGMAVAVGLLLVIAVGNVTNLAIARSVGRQTEIAVRRALGASDSAVARMWITESVLMAVCGSALGVLLATWGTGVLSHVALRSLPPRSTIAVDVRALIFAFGAALVVGLALGVLSATTSGSASLTETLRAGGRGTGATARVHRAREAVLTAQVGLAFALLIGATLLTQSLYNLTRTDVGFSPENLLTFSYDLPAASYEDAASQRAFYSEALPRIRDVPGVSAAAAVTPIPMEMGSVPTSWSLSREVTDAAEPTVMAHMRSVTPEYFAAMGIGLLGGRLFDDTDREDSQQVALVNHEFVDRYLAGRTALSARITAGEADDEDSEWMTIVGVVADVRFRSLRSEAEPEIYIPMQQFPSGWGHLVVRAAGPREHLVRAVTAAVQQVDPDLPLADIKSGEEIISAQSRISRISAALTSLFAVMATVLALVGILGMLSIVVAQRTTEIGLRMALGAQSGSIRGFILARGMRPVVIGIALGVVLSLGATHLLQSQVYGVNTLNLLAFLVPTVGLTVAGSLACVAPCIRASKVDPVKLLRSA